MFKGLATYLIEEFNTLIGSNLTPLKDIVELAYKIAHQIIPDRFSLERQLYKLDGIAQTSIYSYTLDFEFYQFLYEILALSVKLSFAGDELVQQDGADSIIFDTSLSTQSDARKVSVF
jgi:hypothetical protein